MEAPWTNLEAPMEAREGGPLGGPMEAPMENPMEDPMEVRSKFT